MKGRIFQSHAELLTAKSFQPDLTQSQNIFIQVFEIILMANCAGYLL